MAVPTTLEMQRLGGSNQVLGCRVQDRGTGFTGFKTEVPGPSRRGLRRRKPSSDTQAPPPLGECQKLSVSPVSDHQRQAMSVIPAVRQDSDEEPRPEKPLLMDASRKWFLPAVPDVGYRMWAAGRNHHLNREVHIAKASDDVTKMSTPGRRSNRDSQPVMHRQKSSRPRVMPESVWHGITKTAPAVTRHD